MDFRRNTNKRGRIVRGGPGTGGSDGCVNFLDKDNAGLVSCLYNTGINEIYNEWCGKISLADFMVLAAEAVVGSLAEDYDPNNKWGNDTLLSKFKD